MAALTLNERANRLADQMSAEAESLRVNVHLVGGARVLDLGVETTGGVQTGLGLARVCLANLAEVSLVPGTLPGLTCPLVQVWSDQPVLACMASQYAGWQISVGKFFAMGSGPMRAALGEEALFNDIPGKESPPLAVGVLESGKLPGEEVVQYLSEKLNLPADKLTLLVAPAKSIAGCIQVVARSLETALHKLHELKFDLHQIVSGYGTAPVPPVAGNETDAIGRPNDAILYGGEVVLWVECDDDHLAEIGPKVPSSASRDHGAPFAEIFRRYEEKFYKIDPMLFSPARISFHNIKTGRCHTFGEMAPEVLRRSFSS